MHDNIYNPHGKDIRFINSDYKALFAIQDGGRIVVTRPEGELYPGVCEQWVGTCKYLDDYHTEINGECYHIAQFAEIQERIGSTVQPETETEMVGNYSINARTFIGDKIFKFGYNPNAPQPYATWQSYKENPTSNDWGHYWSGKSTARTDFFRRAEAERTGKIYDHTKAYKQQPDRNDAR